MWLLNCRRLLQGGTASEALDGFHGRPPPYAILSHTWREEEVSFQDLKDPRVSQRAGFTKIRHCCEQALQDELEFAWVDTCCIDKTSSAELSEAINSMFRWYSEAKVCYVYLQDVEIFNLLEAPRPGLAFNRSRWFTRGWTLQELLAPDHVVFYSAFWKKIGTKEDLVETLSKITNVDKFFLGPEAGRRFSSGSIAQRMSWVAKRTTTRVEDIAYSLLGIFDINMPLLYGEGTRAFTRLQEELLRQYSDHSIFAWGMSGEGRRGGLLAPSPADFSGSENVIPFFNLHPSMSAPTRIPQGVQIHVRLAPRKEKPLHSEEDQQRGWEGLDPVLRYALLDCHMHGDLHRVVAIPLISTYADRAYSRDQGFVRLLPPSSSSTVSELVSVMDKNAGNSLLVQFDELYQHLSKGVGGPERLMWIWRLPVDFLVVEVYPESCWYQLTNTVEMGAPWLKHLNEARFVKIADQGGRVLILKLMIRRSVIWPGQYCPFARGSPDPSCQISIVDGGKDLRDIAENADSFEWKEEAWLSESERLVVDIQPVTTMGWDMLAVDVGIEQRSEVWKRRTWRVSRRFFQICVGLGIAWLLLRTP